MEHWPKFNEVLDSANRGTPTESGLCVQCRVDCTGKCETFLSCLKGKKMVYPQDHGKVIFGTNNVNPLGVSYNSLRIQGRSFNSEGIPEGLSHKAEDCLYPNVSFATEFGAKVKTKVRVPLKTGAYGSAALAGQYWDSYAVGAALVGFPLVIGENVMNMDKDLVIENGKVVKAPELDRRIESFMRYYDGYGAIVVQLNYDDIYNGPTVDYVCEKYGDKVIIEIKWGQGAKPINGEVITNDIDYAASLQKIGYVIFPDPSDPAVQAAYKEGKVRTFTRQSRVPYTALDNYEQVREEFLKSIEYMRSKGATRIALKTGSFGMESLAMAIKLSSEADIDLLTVDGSGGGTAMSPWNMMEHWGIPSVLVHAKAWEYGNILAARGERVVDMAFSGGFAREDHIFKALALGAPFTKLAAMGRALMIPGFVGSNIEGVLRPERKAAVHGNWDELPAVVKELGSTPEEIFASYSDVRDKVGAEEINNIPFGAIATWTYVDKLMKGLQQLMAGARKFSVNALDRYDIASLNRETERETGVPFITDIEDEIAQRILRS